MRLFRLALILIAGSSFAHIASAQGFGADKHRDELLVPSTGVSLNDRREGQRLYQAAKNYLHGDNGYTKDRDKAMGLFELAARKDYPPALYYLSQIHFVGDGLLADESAGNSLLSRASQLGLQDADVRLAERGVVYSK